MEDCTQTRKFLDAFLQYGLISSALIALCIGYITGSVKRMVVAHAIGVFLSMVIVVPDWQFFTERHFSEWIEPMAADQESRELQRERFPLLKKTTKYSKREDIHPLGILFVLAVFSFSVCFCCNYILN